MARVPKQKTDDLLGIGYMVTSYCLYAVVNCLVKVLGGHISSYNVAFFRYLFSLITLIPFLSIAEFNFKKDIKAFNGYNIMRSAISFVSMMWFSAGLAGTPLNKAMSLTFITPIFVSIMGIFWLKEKSSIEKWIAIFIGLIGGVIIENPASGVLDYSSLYIIGSCFLWALTTLVIKILSEKQDPIMISFYMSLVTVPLSLPYFLYNPYIPTLKEVGIMVALGATYNLAQITGAKAYHLTKLTVVAPFDFMRMILGIVMGYIFFDEVVADNTIIGSVLIIMGATLAVYKEAKAKVRKKGVEASK